MRRTFPTVERSPDKPGPGPVPPAVLRSLDLAVLRRVESLVPGEHLTPQVGAGTELAMIRPYFPGDDVRHIDWNVTARMREPHVREKQQVTSAFAGGALVLLIAGAGFGLLRGGRLP